MIYLKYQNSQYKSSKIKYNYLSENSEFKMLSLKIFSKEDANIYTH